ncbi:nascent polypeptide-associated complex subunit alpha, muscle-specific form-like isoform X2 [Cavia porcellus]|uniref:nascent polypeptide-associated complex subunit alpha, muscle-specific form-like isoform X2 n=1 Tax=Cavia porcellus TaxID=10141 RepID=UPI002FDF2CB9
MEGYSQPRSRPPGVARGPPWPPAHLGAAGLPRSRRLRSPLGLSARGAGTTPAGTPPRPEDAAAAPEGRRKPRPRRRQGARAPPPSGPFHSPASALPPSPIVRAPELRARRRQGRREERSRGGGPACKGVANPARSNRTSLPAAQSAFRLAELAPSRWSEAVFRLPCPSAICCSACGQKPLQTESQNQPFEYLFWLSTEYVPSSVHFHC